MKKFYLVTILIQISLCQNHQDEVNNRSPENYSTKRILQQNKCKVYDNVFGDICQQCQDNFSLPDCQKCPIGSTIVEDMCIKCPQGSLNCDDNTNDLYCFLGFTKKDNYCICNPPKRLTYDWCTQEGEVYYLSYYTAGLINSKFSNEIIINDISDQSQYQFNNNNCDVISNLSEYVNIKTTMECKIKDDQRNLFIISLKNSKSSEGYYKIIPVFNINKLRIKVGLKTRFADILMNQKTSLSGSQQVYFSLNQQMDPLCYPLYYRFIYPPGQIVFPNEHIVVQGLSEAESIKFKINYDTYSLDVIEKQNLINGLNQYPNMKFSFQNNQYVYVVDFKCTVPFGIQTSGQFMISQTYPFQSHQISIPGQIFYSNRNIYFQYEDDITSYYNTKKKDLFRYQVRLLDSSDQTEIKKFPYQDTNKGYIGDVFLDVTNLEAKNYILELSSYYILFPNYIGVLTQQLQYVISKNQITILNKDLLLKVNPLIPLQLNSDFVSSETIGNLEIRWRIDLTVGDTQEWKGQNVSVNTPDNVIFDFGQSSWVQVVAYDLTNSLLNFIAIDRTPLITYLENLIVEYNQSYKTLGLNSQQRLAFSYIYEGYDTLQRNTYTHYFEISYNYQSNPYKFTFEGTIAPQVYLYLKDVIQIEDNQNYQFRFLVKDSSNKIFAYTKKHLFFSNYIPSDCTFSIQPQTGQEKAFIDKIKVTIENCYPFEVQYQFFYYNSDDTQSQENKDQNIFTRKYLTKLQSSNELITFLPSGNIILSVEVVDSYESKTVFNNKITINNSGFSQVDYEQFLSLQQNSIIIYKNNKQFEEELCGIQLVIEAIEIFENDNQNIEPSQNVIELKLYLKNRLIVLPSLIQTKQQSLQLQEFILRCLDRLYKTKNAPDNAQIINRLNDLQDIVKAKAYEMYFFNIFLEDAKDNYQKQMRIALNMNQNFIKEINKTPQNLIPWNKIQLDSFYNIQKLISLTLNLNQNAFQWEGEFVTLIVQRVDSILMINNYLQNLSIPLTRQYDLRIIYDVMIQYWKENIYQKDPSFINLVSPYYSKTSGVIRQELDRVYPAIYPSYIMNYDRPIFTQSQRRILTIEEEGKLQFPADTNLRFEFKDIQGTGNVVCTQKISEVWSKKSCKSVIQKTEQNYKVTCYCSSPSYTTLVFDVETLVSNDNINNIFSEKGVKNIFQKDNWYQYVVFYSIFGINLIMIASLILSVRLDKLSIQGGVSAYLLIASGQRKIQPQFLSEIENKKDNINKDEENQEQKIKQCTNDKENISLKQDDLEKETNQKEQENRLMKNEEGPDFKRRSSLSLLLQKQQETFNQIEHINEKSSQDLEDKIKSKSISLQDNQNPAQQKNTSQITNMTIQSNLNKQITISSVKQSLLETDRQDTIDKTEQIVHQDQESNKMIENDIKGNNQKLIQKRSMNLDENNKNNTGDNKANDRLNNQKTSLTFSSLEKQITQTNTVTKNEEQEQKNESIERKKLIEQENLIKQQKRIKLFFNQISLIRGIAIFHLLIQIILIYNKKLSRTYRFCLYYSQLVWLLTINATFGSEITVAQVFALSILSSSTFFVYNKIIELLQKWKTGRYVSYGIVFLFLCFCYYSIFVSISTSTPYDSNIWMLSFLISLLINLIIIGLISSSLKFFITKRLIQNKLPNNFLFQLITANMVFEMFE